MPEMCRRHGFDPWVGKIPWRREWQPAPVFLPGTSHGQRSLRGYRPRAWKELDTTKQLDSNEGLSEEEPKAVVRTDQHLFCLFVIQTLNTHTHPSHCLVFKYSLFFSIKSLILGPLVYLYIEISTLDWMPITNNQNLLLGVGRTQ